MGFTINAQESQQSQYLDSYSELCGVIMSNAFSITGRIPLLYYLTQNYKKEKKCLEVIHGLSKKVIETRRKEKAANSTIQTDDEVGSKKKQALLDILLEATVDGKPLSDIDIQEEVDTFIFAGHDTTATAINFLLYNLANNPNVQVNIILIINFLEFIMLKLSLIIPRLESPENWKRFSPATIPGRLRTRI